MEKRRFFRRRDWIPAALACVLLGGWLLARQLKGEQPAQAELYLGSQRVLRLSLYEGEPRTFSLPEREHVRFFLDGEGGISFESSDCPEQICVRSGRLSRPGDTAACLPNQLLIRLTAPAPSVDAEV